MFGNDKVSASQGWLNTCHEKWNTNRLRRIRYLAIVKFQQVKIDRMFGMRSEVQTGQEGPNI